MGLFKKTSREVPDLNTSSLPDMIFAVLFFFMVTTTMRTEDPKVKIKLPSATEVQKMERKSLITVINIGSPTDVSRYGTGTQIQLNDKFADVEDISSYIVQEKASMNEADQPFMTVNIKADGDTKMKYISDVKQALRKADALKITYAANKVKEVK